MQGVRDAKLVSVNPGMTRQNDPDLRYEVRITDDRKGANTYAALVWLADRGYRSAVDWDIDMHGGTIGYTSFFFGDEPLAVEFKLVFLGQ